jgi:hypothetical protein
MAAAPMSNLTPHQYLILRAIKACPDMPTVLLLERLAWVKNRHSLKTQICLMRRKGVPIRGARGGDHCGGYHVAP